MYLLLLKFGSSYFQETPLSGFSSLSLPTSYYFLKIVVQLYCFFSSDIDQFEVTLTQELVFVTNFDSFHATFDSALEKFVPLGKKKIRYNKQSFIIKSLCIVILIKCKLKNK